ncbi:hypothetical protein H0H81_002873 [Sphagnurus paluster]|uniref:Cytochrome P450 n=1 Tax=Sphagnurus paluster TaxID=117069 RepID=A0A9P7GT47_9AGAR|nr:hypothetical protein H0H81_002873 [Sphagnurus paluster]
MEARTLAQNLLGDPKEKNNIVTRFPSSIILSIAYGHRVTSDKDRYVLLADEVSGAAATAGALGSSLLDFLPFLQYMPSWFPGTYYANYARKWAPKVKQFRDLPFEDVQRQMKEGTAKPCLLVSELETLGRGPIDGKTTIDDIKGASSLAYIGGVETTTSSLFIFILAMILHPECQARAQAELDAVVGSQRLPEFDDRDSLPYLECLLHETLRWHSPLPTGVPHFTVEDDVYRGMLIPKGSIIVGNARYDEEKDKPLGLLKILTNRAMSWDENIYANPFGFEPTRYLPAPLGRGEPRPVAHWGFGRR